MVIRHGRRREESHSASKGACVLYLRMRVQADKSKMFGEDPNCFAKDLADQTWHFKRVEGRLASVATSKKEQNFPTATIDLSDITHERCILCPDCSTVLALISNIVFDCCVYCP